VTTPKPTLTIGHSTTDPTLKTLLAVDWHELRVGTVRTRDHGVRF